MHQLQNSSQFLKGRMLMFRSSIKHKILKMTKRDFFILLIKIFGLYTLMATLFSAFPRQIGFLLQPLVPINLATIIVLIASIVLVLFIFIVLIFSAEKVVKLLKLDKGFDEERIELGKMDSEQLIKIGVFFIGGLVFIEHLPEFLSQTIFAFKASQIGLEHTEQDKMWWLADGLSFLIGFLLLTNYAFIAKLLKAKVEKA